MPNSELNKRVSVRELMEHTKLQQIIGDDASLNRYIIAPDVNRPGLELSGFKDRNDLKRVVIIGNKERRYLRFLDYEVQVERLKLITDEGTPCIILTENHECPKALSEVATERNFPVFISHHKTYQLTVDIVSFLAEKLAPTELMHGVMMNIYGIGVLLMGKSGIGKSELALDLVRRGHMLVADDSVELSAAYDDIYAVCPELLRRMLEIRGVGIIDITLMYGASSYLEKSKLDFVINLRRLEDTIDNDRLNPDNDFIEICGHNVPMLTIPVSEGKALDVIIETAVTNHILKSRGIDTNEIFKDNVMQAIIKKNMENSK